MKVWLLATVTCLAGLAAGVGSAYVQYASKPVYTVTKPSLALDYHPSELPLPESGQPRAVLVGEATYDFGVMGRDETRTHTFVARNEGTAPLTLRFLDKSCQCTSVSLSKDIVPPGESVDITLSWKPNDYKLNFQQTAIFETNDPTQRELHLSVKGRVQQIVRYAPLEVSLGSVRQGQARQFTIDVFSYREEDFEVKRATILYPETAANFSVQVDPMDPNRVAKEPGAKRGYVVSVQLEPGLPVGPVFQRLRLFTNLPDVEPMDIPIRGRVAGNLTILGSGFSSQDNVLRLGPLAGSTSHERRLWILVKEQPSDPIQFQVRSTDPASVLQAEIGEPIQAGTLTRYPLTVRVVPDGRTTTRLGSEQGDWGTIVIDTTDPEDKELVIYVSFAVEGNK